MITEIKSNTAGLIGFLHEVECKDSESILVFQLPRRTDMLNEHYLRTAMDAIKHSLPTGRNALIIGADVNVYELFGQDAAILKLKGII